MNSKTTRFAAAACLLFGILMWYMTIGPAGITFADVEDSIASKKWICIKFNDGAEQWANLKTKQTFYTYRNKNNFYAGMRDHVKGLWTCHHSNWAKQIHVESFTPRPYPLTAWDYATGEWNDTGSPAPDKIERFEDTIDGKAVVRFDMYNLGPSGLRAICKKVWADPETRLPLRIEVYSSSEDSHTGDFTFPDSGPSSIHDFGVSKDLKIVRNFGIIEPEAVAIIDAAKQASKNLPKEMRIIDKDQQSNTFNVCYRLGNKFRKEFYVPDDYTNVSLSVEPPEDPEQMQQWAHSNQLSLEALEIFDGKHEYSYSERQATMRVKRLTADGIDGLIQIQNQWPYINMVGPMIVIDDEPETPEGCVLLRHAGPDLKMDFYVDPKRDYICVKKLRWDKDKSTNKWIMAPYFQQQRSDLSRLPSGQWYAQTIIDSQGKEHHRYVQILTDADKERLAELDKTVGFFDGEKLLKEAKAKKAKVSFWAR